jgi:hypothetical protein
MSRALAHPAVFLFLGFLATFLVGLFTLLALLPFHLPSSANTLIVMATMTISAALTTLWRYSHHA